jgi:hypothetical protein
MIQNLLCPTLLAPKKMLQGGFGDFCFYEIAMAADGFGFGDDERTCRIMTKDPSKGTWQCVASSLSMPVSIGDALVSIGY